MVGLRLFLYAANLFGLRACCRFSSLVLAPLPHALTFPPLCHMHGWNIGARFGLHRTRLLVLFTRVPLYTTHSSSPHMPRASGHAFASWFPLLGSLLFLWCPGSLPTQLWFPFHAWILPFGCLPWFLFIVHVHPWGLDIATGQHHRSDVAVARTRLLPYRPALTLLPCADYLHRSFAPPALHQRTHTRLIRTGSLYARVGCLDRLLSRSLYGFRALWFWLPLALDARRLISDALGSFLFGLRFIRLTHAGCDMPCLHTGSG